MARIVLVTSFKGGVGKTTLAANLSMCLAKKNLSVCAVDCDLESRCLDLVASLDDVPMYNVVDVIKKRCTLDKALVEDSRNGNLHFITSPAFFPESEEDALFEQDDVSDFLNALAEDYDYIILDLPARPDALYKYLVRMATDVIVVSMQTATSLRSAEKTAMAISRMREGLTDVPIQLVVNSFQLKDTRKGDNVGLFDILEKTHLPLLGLLPFDRDMAREQEKGHVAFEVKTPLAYFFAVQSVADRLEGVHVPLLKNIKTWVKPKDIF